MIARTVYRLAFLVARAIHDLGRADRTARPPVPAPCAAPQSPERSGLPGAQAQGVAPLPGR
jgi:hypothetical protein